MIILVFMKLNVIVSIPRGIGVGGGGIPYERDEDARRLSARPLRVFRTESPIFFSSRGLVNVGVHPILSEILRDLRKG